MSITEIHYVSGRPTQHLFPSDRMKRSTTRSRVFALAADELRVLVDAKLSGKYQVNEPLAKLLFCGIQNGIGT
jgi:hypothetical protein